uniref:Uncharacterized protein n=1 Tax=Anguilla anguilla TaxID=7936 RepID=A0A0E9ST90_ANGAN
MLRNRSIAFWISKSKWHVSLYYVYLKIGASRISR